MLRKADELNAPRNRMLALLKETGGFFSEFHSPQILSVPHYRARVEELKALGMVWLQSLWALLDDLEQRGERRL